MELQNTIAAEDYCLHAHVEISFIKALEQYGLITTASINEQILLEPAQLPELEKYTRLYYDLNINLEGIEAIANLLNRIDNLHKEMLSLQNRLSGYEL